MGRKVRWGMLAVLVALAGVPVVLATTPAGATTASVSTVEEFWDAWTDPNVTQIDLENSIDLATDSNYPGTPDYSCEPDGGYYPERHPNGDTLVDGHGFTLTMTCDHNSVLFTFGTGTLTVQNITLTHSGAPSPTVGGNGIAMGTANADVVVINSTITGNWLEGDTCSTSLDVGSASLCISVGGGISADGDVTVTGSTISNNRAPGRGGGIFANGRVTVTDSVVSDNHATEADDSFNGGGGILGNDDVIIDGVTFERNVAGCEEECYALGGAIASIGASIANSTFTENVAGCDEDCGNIGGAIYTVNRLTLTGSTLTDNRATCENGCQAAGGGVAATGYDYSEDSIESAGYAGWAGPAEDLPEVPGPVVIANTLFDGNLATTTAAEGGNCGCEGGGVYVDDETSVKVSGSTFTGNEAYYDGGAIHIDDDTPLEVVNSTITANTSATGAVFSDDGTVTLAYDTIVDNVLHEVLDISVGSSQYFDGGDVHATAEPGASITAPDLVAFATVLTGSGTDANCNVGTSTSYGYNFSDDTSCLTAPQSTDSQSATNDPQVGALGDNGGPTPTMLPTTLSPLVDAIPTADCQTGPAAGITVDQRGVTRPQMLGCDIGAVEVEAPPVAIEPTFTG